MRLRPAKPSPQAPVRQADARWQPLVWAELPQTRGKLMPNVGPHGVGWINALYTVQVRSFPYPEPWGRVIHLSITNRDRSARRDWRHFQKIKNQLAGPEWTAVEIYPPESCLTDEANSFHLFCFEARCLPFMWEKRSICVNTPGSQRPFAHGDAPEDVVDFSTEGVAL